MMSITKEDLVIDDIYMSDDVSLNLTMPGTGTRQMWQLAATFANNVTAVAMAQRKRTQRGGT